GCKAYVELTGGGHCNFANSNFNCSFGELTCGGAGSLGRPAQQALAQQYTLLWLDRYLKDDAQAGADLEALLLAGQGITAQSEFTDCPPIVVRVEPKLLLDGPYDEQTDLLADSLRVQGVLPVIEPNTAAGFTHVGPGAGETLDPALLSVAGPDAVVDWVFLELRDAASGTQVQATANGLVQRDGDVVSPQGGPVVFEADAGNYRLVARHRNHLGVMTDAAFTLSRDPIPVDLSDPALAT
ncbi:MAG: hypothetical protein KDC02_24070, partial [Flavobacteriales bacterium]|nr:hypothetical protein [Flavobacteriales bacterium]